MALNPWLLGRHVTALRVQVLSVIEATGAVAVPADPAGSAANMRANLVVTSGLLLDGTLTFTTGLMNNVRIMSDKESDNISPANSLRSHAVPIKTGFDISISEVLAHGGSRLAQVYFGGTSNYCRLTFARGGDRWTIDGVFTGYSETIQRGKNIGTLSVSSVDNGAPLFVAGEQPA